MALSRFVSEIFNVEKYCDLEILVKGQSRLSKVVPFDRLCLVFLLVSSTRTVFEIFDFKNAVTLKTGLGVRQDHRSIKRIWLPIDV